MHSVYQSRLLIPWKTVCGEKIENAQYRLKLLNKDVKTSYFEEKSAHTSDL